jgi:excisionase family DNA binding protein
VDSRPHITLSEAAERLNVHYMTAYRYVRTGRLTARQESRRWTVAVSDLRAFGPAGRRPRGTGRSASRDQLIDRLVAGDERGAWLVVDAALASGMDASGVHLDLISSALRIIGERWAAGELSVSAEHRASGVATRLIGRLGPLFAHRGRKRGTIVVGTAAGDVYALPSAILADVLRGARFEVIDLGANTPPDAFARSAGEPDRLVAVLVGATSHGHGKALAGAVNAVRDARRDARILVGGAAVANDGAAARLGADGWSGHDARQAVTPIEARLR